MIRTRVFSMAIAAAGYFLTAGQTFASPVVMSNATYAFSLAQASNCYQMAVAYNPGTNQYYGAGGGSPNCNGDVWNAAGAKLQSLSPINIDIRGVNYNANNGSIEIIGYGSQSGYGSNSGYSGLYTMDLDASGLYTGNYTQVLTSLPGIKDNQSVAAYDSKRDVFYSQQGGSEVAVAKRSDGTFTNSIVLTGTSLSGVNANAIGYDLINDVLIEYNSQENTALVFDMSGAFIGASMLNAGTSYDSNYAMSYSNGFLFVGKGSNSGYDAYRIFEAPNAVPEPTTVALFGLGLIGFAASRRSSAKNRHA